MSQSLYGDDESVERTWLREPLSGSLCECSTWPLAFLVIPQHIR